MKQFHGYCEAQVRERDRTRFLATLFAPADKRPHLYALYAFDLEIAHIADVVREPLAGEIRLQWWREAVNGERAGEAGANPVAAALRDMIEAHGIACAPLIEMIDAHAFDLLREPMDSHAALQAYLDNAVAIPIRLAAAILDTSRDATRLASMAGRAIGLTNILRSFARDVSAGRLFVPLDLLASHEVHTASVLSGENSERLRQALEAMRKDARRNYLELRDQSIAASILPALLPAALVPAQLARMEKPGYDPFTSNVALSRLRSQFAIWRAAKFGTV